MKARILKFKSIVMWKFYLVIFVLSPVSLAIAILYHVQFNSQNTSRLIGVCLFFGSIITAHRVSTTWTELSIGDGKITFHKTKIPIAAIQNYRVNRFGIGMTAIEFTMNSGVVKRINIAGYRTIHSNLINSIDDALSSEITKVSSKITD